MKVTKAKRKFVFVAFLFFVKKQVKNSKRTIRKKQELSGRNTRGKQ